MSKSPCQKRGLFLLGRLCFTALKHNLNHTEDTRNIILQLIVPKFDRDEVNDACTEPIEV